ncbi:MAG: SusD/RagB family nutrient-binding outer membrane lipoprotein, partial [Niabella sp.]
NQEYVLLGAAAKIMKVLHFQLLVDTYNNVPYTAANSGIGDLTPAYDKGTDIYKSLADLLDEAITDINGASSAAKSLNSASDPLFGGNMTKWKQLANTVKLRLILRGGNKVSFTNQTFSSDGFLTEDALVQPGYANVDGKLNPKWGRTYTVAGAQVAGLWQQRVPSFFTLAFYDGNKISDKYRGNLVYRTYPTPGVNMLGRDPGTETAARVKAPNDWFISLASTPSATNYAGIGIIKGPTAAQPIILASESFFLQAEGVIRGVITGDAKALFNSGILESFKYLNKNESGATSGLYVNTTSGKLASTSGTGIIAINPQTEFNSYVAESQNATSYLVNFDLATTFEQKLEAIITQKYIALNGLFGHEAWNEYRRTHYPVSVSPPAYPGTRYTSLVSLQSQSTAADRLPTRIQYPQNEFTYNGDNVRAQTGSGDGGLISVFLDKIFWAK